MIDFIAIGLAVIMSIAQGLLLRGVSQAAPAGLRAALLAVKLPLWAGFFVVLALIDKRALFTGGIAAAIAFPAAAWLMRYRHKEE